MLRPCEICCQGPAQKEAESCIYVLIENRVVALCEAHAKAVKKARIKTVAALEALFHETTGARSKLPRRAAQNRRLFPPRPEGRRKSDGRRWSDALHE